MKFSTVNHLSYHKEIKCYNPKSQKQNQPGGTDGILSHVNHSIMICEFTGRSMSSCTVCGRGKIASKCNTLFCDPAVWNNVSGWFHTSQRKHVLVFILMARSCFMLYDDWLPNWAEKLGEKKLCPLYLPYTRSTSVSVCLYYSYWVVNSIFFFLD